MNINRKILIFVIIFLCLISFVTAETFLVDSYNGDLQDGVGGYPCNTGATSIVQPIQMLGTSGNIGDNFTMSYYFSVGTTLLATDLVNFTVVGATASGQPTNTIYCEGTSLYSGSRYDTEGYVNSSCILTQDIPENTWVIPILVVQPNAGRIFVAYSDNAVSSGDYHGMPNYGRFDSNNNYCDPRLMTASTDFSDRAMNFNAYIIESTAINPVFEYPTPNDLTYSNIPNPTFNISCSIGNVSLWLDTNPNPITPIIINEISPASYTANFTNEGVYYYKASCNNGELNSSVRSYGYHFTPPNFEKLKDFNSNSFNIDLKKYINVTDKEVGVDSCLVNFTHIDTNYSTLVNCNDSLILPYIGFYNMNSTFNDTVGNSDYNNSIFKIDVSNNLIFYNNNTGNPINNTEIIINFPLGSSLSLITNSSGGVNFSSIVNNVVNLGLYNFTFADNYGYLSPISFTKLTNISSFPITENYYINTAKIIINIYDRETKILIDENISVQIVNILTTNTINGTIIIEDVLITPNTYEVILESNNYVSEKSSFSFTNQEILTLNLYMIRQNSTALGNLIVQVYDDFYNIIVNADTRLLEYDSTVSSFVEVSQCKTDTNGECVYSVQLNERYYIITASAVINGLYSSTQSTEGGSIIKLDNTIIELHLRASEPYIVSELYDLHITPYNTSLIGNVSYLSASFNDDSNLDHNVCIGYFVYQNFKENLLTENCIYSSSGIINVDGGYLLNRTFTNIAKIYVKKENGVIETYATYIYESIDNSFNDTFSYYAKPILLFLCLVLLATAIQLKNINIFAFGMIPLSLFSVIFIPTILGGATITFIIVECLTIVYLSKKKTESY